MFLFENVKGLFSKKYDGKAGAMYRHICKEFQETDPKTGVTFKLAETDPHKVLLRAIEYGVPQNRERLFLVGVNARYPQGVFHYPEKTHGPGRKYPYVTVEDALMDLPALDSKEENNTCQGYPSPLRLPATHARAVQHAACQLRLWQEFTF